MKKFKHKVRWDFKVSIQGYGTNVLQAMKYALEHKRYEMDYPTFEKLKFIEENETVQIDESDTEPQL